MVLRYQLITLLLLGSVIGVVGQEEEQQRKQIEVGPQFENFFMSLTTGGGLTQTNLQQQSSHPHQRLKGKMSWSVPLEISAGYRFTPNINVKAGLRNVLQSFTVEAVYPDHTYKTSVGATATQIPISIGIERTVTQGLGLFGRFGFSYNFYNGAETFTDRTTQASSSEWSIDKKMNIQTAITWGYHSKMGLLIPNIAPKAELTLGVGYHGINKNVMEGTLTHTDASGTEEHYVYQAQGDYLSVEVSYQYNLKTGLEVEKEDVSDKNAFFLEVGGAGGLYSVNYDRIFWVERYFKLSGRAGLLFVPQTEATDLPDVGAPLSINGLLFETKDHHLELGVGQTFTTSNGIDISVDKATYQRGATFTGTGFLGYRYQKNHSGFLFRAGYSPLWVGYDYWKHWMGVSLGTSF